MKYWETIADNLSKAGWRGARRGRLRPRSLYHSGGFRTLNEGGRVSFDVVEGPKGLVADNVVKISRSRFALRNALNFSG
jgi:hypothetical protein